jgi:deazaflavin-dependent oxidoreductase (nitroreductase family)
MSGSFGPKVRFQRFSSRYITPHLPVRQLYQRTGGRIGGSVPGMRPHLLLLTVTGRRSGRLRTLPLVYFEIEGKLVVGATELGAVRDPAWCRNLRDLPEATVQLGKSTFPVTAREVEGEERERLWATMTDVHPLFALYQRDTPRNIPVFVLDRPA